MVSGGSISGIGGGGAVGGGGGDEDPPGGPRGYKKEPPASAPSVSSAKVRVWRHYSQIK